MPQPRKSWEKSFLYFREYKPHVEGRLVRSIVLNEKMGHFVIVLSQAIK